MRITQSISATAIRYLLCSHGLRTLCIVTGVVPPARPRTIMEFRDLYLSPLFSSLTDLAATRCMHIRGCRPKAILARGPLVSPMPTIPTREATSRRFLRVCAASLSLVTFCLLVTPPPPLAPTRRRPGRRAAPRGPSWPGTVRDPAGAVVADASVFFEKMGGHQCIVNPPPMQTKADGTFSLSMRAGSYVVRARKATFQETVNRQR